MGFDGRVALVTGGTRGIGAAVSERLLDEGASVTALYAGNEESARRFGAAMTGRPGSLTLYRADIGSRENCRAAVSDVLLKQGRLDYLVNNAGALIEAPVRDVTSDEWDRALAVNLSASFHLAQAALESMVDRRFGRIVNVSSVTALMGNPVEAAYGAAKAGLHGLTRSLARSVARKGITVNVVVPGVFDTDMTADMDPADQAAIRAMIPAGRRGDPAELAHAVMFLLDDRAGYVTGSVVTVDGGLSMGG